MLAFHPTGAFLAPMQLLLLLTFGATGVNAVKSLQLVSPLQALTIWDSEFKEEPHPTFRCRFLSRFRVGLSAEVAARKQLAAAKADDESVQPVDASSKNWAGKAAAADRLRAMKNDQLVEQAYDSAVAQYDSEQASAKLRSQPRKNPNRYQFVGVINEASSSRPPITWYSRKKPHNAKWSVRLVHVNREAIIKDLFNRGRVDVLAKYENTGKRDEATNQPIVTSKYIVRERSWK
jgi:hypothetical protein